jgi:glutathione S-transferase
VQVRGALRELQQALRANKGYVLGRFTYADIVMAVSSLVLPQQQGRAAGQHDQHYGTVLQVALQVVEPIGPPYAK